MKGHPVSKHQRLRALKNSNARVYTVALWSAGTREAPAPVDASNCGVVFAAAQDDPI